MRSVAILAVTVLATLVAGCGAQDGTRAETRRPTQATHSPSTSPSPVQVELPAGVSERLVRAQRASTQWAGTTMAGTAAQGDVAARVTATADLRTSAFRADVRGQRSFTVLRTHNVTWVRADRGFWVAAGYTAESGDRADGRWVLYEQSAGDRLRDQLDPGVLLEAVQHVPVSAIASARRIRVDGRPTWELTEVVDGYRRTILMSRSGPAQIVGLRVEKGAVSADLTFDELQDGARIDAPRAADVVEP